MLIFTLLFMSVSCLQMEKIFSTNSHEPPGHVFSWSFQILLVVVLCRKSPRITVLCVLSNFVMLCSFSPCWEDEQFLQQGSLTAWRQVSRCSSRWTMAAVLTMKRLRQRTSWIGVGWSWACRHGVPGMWPWYMLIFQFLHIFYSLTLHREYQIGARGGDTRHMIMYRYRLWLKRELLLHSQGISLVNLARWCWTCHGAMWLKLLCLRLYRELNRRMEGVKSWDVVSCRAAKLHQDPTSGYQWLHHEKQEHKGVCQMNPQVVKYKNEIQWNTSQYIYMVCPWKLLLLAWL